MTGLSVAERTHFVIISVAAGSLPMEAPPPAEWKAWEQEKFSSKPSTPACVNTFAAFTQSSSLRLDVRIMDAKMGRSGNSLLILCTTSAHQSKSWVLLTSMFVKPTGFPLTFTVLKRGVTLVCAFRSIATVLRIAPPQPQSNARRTFSAESVSGPDAKINGLGNLTPQTSALKLTP